MYNIIGLGICEASFWTRDVSADAKMQSDL